MDLLRRYGGEISRMSQKYELIIGDKNISSWSLRPWLVLVQFAIPFEERLIRLRQSGSASEILQYSPSGKVPALKVGGLVIWDSLAIIEFLADRHPDKAIWPADPEARAIARSASAEMHSGFQALRTEFPMDFIHKLGFPDASKKAHADIRRIVTLWRYCRQYFGAGGPFLFGTFTAADAMFAPVVSRFVSYEVDLDRFGDDGAAIQYRDAVMVLPAWRAWADAARLES